MFIFTTQFHGKPILQTSIDANITTLLSIYENLPLELQARPHLLNSFMFQLGLRTLGLTAILSQPLHNRPIKSYFLKENSDTVYGISCDYTSLILRMPIFAYLSEKKDIEIDLALHPTSDTLLEDLISAFEYRVASHIEPGLIPVQDIIETVKVSRPNPRFDVKSKLKFENDAYQLYVASGSLDGEEFIERRYVRVI